MIDPDKLRALDEAASKFPEHTIVGIRPRNDVRHYLYDNRAAIIAMAEREKRMREALDQCSDILARFTHSRSMDEKHVSARAVLTLARRALGVEKAS